MGASPWSQAGARVRFDWSLGGLDTLLDGVAGPAVVVVVDVLSFSTAVVAACGAGVLVRPAPLGGIDPPDVPAGAVLAGERGDGRPSLSPGSLTQLRAGTRIVLPSPNGGALGSAAAAHGARVLAGSIRNAGAWARISHSACPRTRPSPRS